MHAPHPARLPQRVVVTGPAGPALDAFVARVATALDLPLLGIEDAADPADARRVADFEGWLLATTTLVPPAAVLGRADLVVHAVTGSTGALRGLVKRARRKLLADAADDVPAWFVAAELARPEATVRLDGPEDVEAWLAALA